MYILLHTISIYRAEFLIHIKHLFMKQYNKVLHMLYLTIFVEIFILILSNTKNVAQEDCHGIPIQ